MCEEMANLVIPSLLLFLWLCLHIHLWFQVYFLMAGRNELILMVEFILSIIKTVPRIGTILGPKEKMPNPVCFNCSIGSGAPITVLWWAIYSQCSWHRKKYQNFIINSIFKVDYHFLRNEVKFQVFTKEDIVDHRSGSEQNQCLYQNQARLLLNWILTINMSKRLWT